MDRTLPHRQRLRSAMVWSILGTNCVGACTHWEVQSVSPQQVLETRHPEKIRVTRTDRTELVLSQPRIESDTLYGVSGGSSRGGGQGTAEGIPLADVSRVAISRVDPAATAGLVVGSGAVVFGIIVVIALATIPED